MSIRRLPQDLVDQIAAGEVVERPASLVKELVENSLDAGATRIEVKVEGGGRRRLVVHDDGCGIPADELPLAIESHATSKLAEAEDLVAVASYGFRGEALASIGSISHLTITSRPADEPEGATIVVRGGVVEAVRPESRAAGTTVDVRDVFFNTPARRKFLKSDPTEVGHILETVLRLSLARPDVSFQLETGTRRSLKLAAGQSLRERIAAGYGRELADSLLPVEGGFAGLRLHGLIAPPDQARARSRLQHLYVNGRYVRDRTVQGAVRRAYSDYLAESLSPLYFLFLDMEPAAVDCNVHPTKTEVRMRNSSDVFRVVLHAIDRALREADLAPRFRIGAATGEATARPSFAAAASPAQVRETAALFTSRPPGSPSPPASADPTATGTAQPYAHAPLHIQPGRYVQVLQTYLVTATAEGLLVLDQHALHERVLYRHIREQWRSTQVRRQDLLTPIRVELPAQDVVVLEDSTELLEQVGLRLAPFGSTEVAVSSVPAALGARDPAGLVRRVAEYLRGDRPDGRLDDFIDRMLFTMACHRAVRAGDALNEQQIQSLLEEAERIEHAHTCPHGRPTRVVIPLAELENLFKRRGF